MPLLTYNSPVVGSPHSTEDPKVRAALVAIKDLFNGNLDADNLANDAVTGPKLADALAEALGLNKTGNAGRDYVAVATSESTSSSSYTDLSTVGPSVTVDVPADGWVTLFVQCTVTPSSAGIASVGLYEATDYSTPLDVLAAAANSGAQTRVCVPGSTEGVNPSSQGPGGFIQLPATAGSRTYTLKYKSASGSATFANRKLWVIAGGPM